MKVEPHLTVVKGQAASGSGTQATIRTASGRALEGVVTLISQENRQAWRLDPQSLEEAKRLLMKVQNNLGANPGGHLAEVHRLEPRCLVKLR